jgi:predicted flavoprotein YhiN
LRQAGLSPQAAGLLREAGAALPGEPAALAALIKSAPVRLVATAGLARAISTAGGVELSEVNDNFMLMRRPGVFLAGEMLDWEAPTGGYLLQACFATGAAAARGALHWLASGS